MSKRYQTGFSLIEVMMVMAIFLVVTSAVFGLMNATQVQYRNESLFMESFEGARLGVDLVMRDVRNAGYPPPFTFAGNLRNLASGGPTPITLLPMGTPVWKQPWQAPDALRRQFALGLLGVRGGLADDCTVNGVGGGYLECDIPNAWEFLIETNLDPERGPQVEWIYYDLRRNANGETSTLYRTVKPKVPGTTPMLNASVLPFVEEILQDPTAAVDATNLATFTYDCDPMMVLIPLSNICLADHIRTVHVVLRVRSRLAILSSNPPRYREVTVQGAASRQYPNRPAVNRP